jgi:hypothetical protein
MNGHDEAVVRVSRALSDMRDPRDRAIEDSELTNQGEVRNVAGSLNLT